MYRTIAGGRTNDIQSTADAENLCRAQYEGCLDELKECCYDCGNETCENCGVIEDGEFRCLDCADDARLARVKSDPKAYLQFLLGYIAGTADADEYARALDIIAQARFLLDYPGFERVAA